MAHRWIKSSPMMDGSGVVEVNGQPFNVAVHDLVTTKHRVAFQDGAEKARASTFVRLIRKLEALTAP